MIENLVTELIRAVNLFTGKYSSNATNNQNMDSGYRSHCKCLLFQVTVTSNIGSIVFSKIDENHCKQTLASLP